MKQIKIEFKTGKEVHIIIWGDIYKNKKYVSIVSKEKQITIELFSDPESPVPMHNHAITDLNELNKLIRLYDEKT